MGFDTAHSDLSVAINIGSGFGFAPKPDYCATGEEMPLYEPCKDRKDERNI